MSSRRSIGPFMTVATVGVVGLGLWMVNVSQTPAPSAPVTQAPIAPAAAAPPAQEASPVVSAIPAPQSFPTWAEYVADIGVQGRTLTVEITVDGQNATAYACDNAGIETWLSGRATDGVLRLTDTTGANRLNGQLRGDIIAGTLWIGERSWEFEAARAGGGNGY